MTLRAVLSLRWSALVPVQASQMLIQKLWLPMQYRDTTLPTAWYVIEIGSDLSLCSSQATSPTHFALPPELSYSAISKPGGGVKRVSRSWGGGSFLFLAHMGSVMSLYRIGNPKVSELSYSMPGSPCVECSAPGTLLQAVYSQLWWHNREQSTTWSLQGGKWPLSTNLQSFITPTDTNAMVKSISLLPLTTML